MILGIAEYRPDVSDYNSAYTNELRNVFSADGSYVPAPSLSPLSAAIGEIPLNGFSLFALDGSINVFVGSASKLYKLNNTTLAFDDVSQYAYAAGEDNPWSFAAFGNYVIAVNKNNDPQVYEVGVDVEFRNLGGSPPRAGIVRIWGDFVALMDLTTNPQRVQWSGLNNAEYWTPGGQNSDYQDFPDGGRVLGSSESSNPIIFLRRAIYRGTFVPGSVEIFTFQKLHDKVGAKSSLSITSRGSYIFFCDEGGFFQIGTDGALANIGFEKVDKTIFTQLQSSSISRIVGMVDPFHSRVYWGLDFTGSGIFDTVIVYDWNLQKWTPLYINTYVLFPLAQPGKTLESLDAISSTLEGLPYSLDAKVWQGGAPVLGGIPEDLRLSVFQGPPLEAVITTTEIGDPVKVMRMSEVTPIVDTDQVFVSVGARFRRSDDYTWLPEREPSWNTGIVRKRSRARYHKVRVRIPEGVMWSHMQGVNGEFTDAGMR